jgi:hypothetical protein
MTEMMTDSANDVLAGANMPKAFTISISVLPEMLQNPPPQLTHRRLLYTPLCINVGGTPFPHGVWCDFTGPLLLRWNREVRRLMAREARYARLIFCDTPCEVWLRQTEGPWWKATCVRWRSKIKTILAEALCLPEQVEAELHVATQRLLEAARKARVWSEDAAALEEFLNGPIVSSGTRQ